MNPPHYQDATVTLPERGRSMNDAIVEKNECPACGAQQGDACRTVIDGIDTGWTHDARLFAHMGVRGA